MKRCLVSPPILGHTNVDIPFVVYSNATDIRIEEVLEYGSRRLNKEHMDIFNGASEDEEFLGFPLKLSNCLNCTSISKRNTAIQPA